MDILKIKEISTGDVKALFDFTHFRIKEIIEEANKKNIEVNSIEVYKETRQLEAKLYDEMLNRMTNIE